MPDFRIVSDFRPTGDQPLAIADLTRGIRQGDTFQTLLGVTGSGKTYTVANVVQELQRPTLVLAPNKTLAAQLYAEYKEFFPDNAVEYFVSYYDYYQPEAYIARSDTYIEKDSSRNDEIDRLRLSATRSLFSRSDVLIVASVSCIYGLGDPDAYGDVVVSLQRDEVRKRDKLLRQLTHILYERNDMAFTRGTFRVRGDVVEIYPAYEQLAIRIEFFGDTVERIVELDPLTGEIMASRDSIDIYPARHFVTTDEKLKQAMVSIEEELHEALNVMKGAGKVLEAARLEQRTMFDLEMMRETGFCNGVENYARHLSQREPGSRPWTLLDYFPDDFLLFVDESHVALPQVQGMYFGDRSRKETLVEYGFRLPSAMDNRPLTFQEFRERIHQAVFVSATPGPYELEHSVHVVEQIVRPTGLLDPTIEVKPTDHQIDDLLAVIGARTAASQRALVTTLTKKMAEDLADYMREMGIKVHYLHSEMDVMERVEILRDLRLGIYDVVVGINLLREGLDLPEVSLVAILDADKEGYLRSERSLIQTIGRAARHLDGHVVMYADRVTDSMRKAIDETYRRRARQLKYNELHGITPVGIQKAIRDRADLVRAVAEERVEYHTPNEIPKDELARLVKDLEGQMKQAAKNLEFERAASVRDQIVEMRRRMEEMPSVAGR